jgi:hypothetical protein
MHLSITILLAHLFAYVCLLILIGIGLLVLVRFVACLLDCLSICLLLSMLLSLLLSLIAQLLDQQALINCLFVCLFAFLLCLCACLPVALLCLLAVQLFCLHFLVYAIAFFCMIVITSKVRSWSGCCCCVINIYFKTLFIGSFNDAHIHMQKWSEGNNSFPPFLLSFFSLFPSFSSFPSLSPPFRLAA